LADEAENELSFLPTPNATDCKGSGGPGDMDLPEAVSLLPTPAARDYKSGESNLLERNARPLNEVAVNQLRPVGGIVDWGRYARAVLWWEQVFGRMAPCPLEPGRGSNLVLAPVFVEWMMGLPLGWVTDLPLSRNAQLKLLGNGVVPQQVVLGLSILLPRVPVLWKQ
jgi:DNA (cytosine-5)-methyltransferase 1